MKRFAALLLLSAVSVARAFAADQGGYVALDLGSAHFSGANFGGPGNLVFPNPGVFQISGGVRLDQNFGVEGGLVLVGNSTLVSAAGTEMLQTSALYIAAVGTLPVSDQFELFGKLGFSSTKIDYTSTFLPPASASQGNLMFGLGARFNVSRNFGVHMQYENFGNVDFPFGALGLPQANSIGLSTFTVGTIFSF